MVSGGLIRHMLQADEAHTQGRHIGRIRQACKAHKAPAAPQDLLCLLRDPWRGISCLHPNPTS